MRSGLVVLWSCVAAISAHAQSTYFVDDDATGDPGPGDPLISDPIEDGSLDHPFDAIQEAIDWAHDGDEIIVSPGTYTGQGNQDIDFSGKAITLRGTDPTDPAIVAATVIDCQGSAATPHRGFIFQNGETDASVLAGLTITHGHTADGSDGDEVSPDGTDGAHGGGIYCHFSSPAISYCVITDNHTGRGGDGYSSGTGGAGGNGGCGGGMYCSLDSVPVITHCTFSLNSCGRGGQSADFLATPGGYGGLGGGICAMSGADVQISQCTVEGNMAGLGGMGLFESDGGSGGDGGGVYVAGNLLVTESMLSANTTGQGGDADSYMGSSAGSGGAGGGVFDAGELTVVDSTLVGNETAGGGNHLYWNTGSGGDGGDGAGAAGAERIATQGCVFLENVTGDGGTTAAMSFGGDGGCGGAIYAFATCTLDMIDTDVTANNCGAGGSGLFGGDGGDGGGVAVGGGGSIDTCTFQDNQAGVGHPGDAGGAGGNGGAIFTWSTACRVVGTDIIDNRAGRAGDGEHGHIGGSGGGLYGQIDLTVSSCTIRGNQAGDGSDGTFYGGGEGGHGGGIGAGSGAVVQRCWIEGNRAGDGGGNGSIADFRQGGAGGSGAGIAGGDGASIAYCLIAGNLAGQAQDVTYLPERFIGGPGGSGGGILCGTGATIVGCLVIDNEAGNGASAMGGCYSCTGGDGGSGAGITAGAGTTLRNCTVSRNIAGLAGGGSGADGLDGPGGGIDITADSTVTNSIVWYNDASSDPQIHSAPNVSHSCVQGGWLGPGHDNIDTAPGFVAPAIGEDSPARDGLFASSDYRLLAESPCVDLGDNSAVTETDDLDSNPRIVDGDGDGTPTVDAGPYERETPPLCDGVTCTHLDTACAVGVCDPANGVCYAEPAHEGDSCDAGGGPASGVCTNGTCVNIAPPCTSDADCVRARNDACGWDACNTGYGYCDPEIPVVYGDVTGGEIGQPPNGTVNLTDVLCALDAFGPEQMDACPNADVATNYQADCPQGNGIVNLSDVLAIANALGAPEAPMATFHCDCPLNP